MSGKNYLILILILCALALASCNLPSRQNTQSPGSTLATPPLPASSPTPLPLCSNSYFPSTQGDTWEYSGSNTISGAYTRTDVVSNSSNTSFTIATKLSDNAYTLIYSCTSAGLLADNPVQQYAGALLNSPNAPLSVVVTSNNGLSLPAQVKPGDTWQQTADFSATSQDLNLSGRFVFNYTAVDFEDISVPAGSFNALLVDATIRVEVSGLHILAGTYTTSSWLVAGIGLVKASGTSHVPGIDFSDAMQLTQFSPSP